MATIEELIRRLGSDSFTEREQAQAQLAQFGFAAFDALLVAEQDNDIEIAARARYLVRLMQVQWVHEGDSPTVRRMLERYDALDESDRLKLIRQLSQLPGGEGVVPLCRLVRFEKSEILAKWAAVELITHATRKDVDLTKRGTAIVETLSRSPRPAADWLRVYARAHENPQEHIVAWGKIVDAEQAILEQFPDQSRSEILIALLREQIQRLDELDRSEEVIVAMQRIVQFERGDRENLLELLDWLVERKAWSVVDQLANRFAVRIADEPVVLYTLADARLQEGREEEAEELAKQALAVKPGDPAEHLQTAQTLRANGKPQWAEAELQHVVDMGQVDNGTTLLACFLLADLIYDRAEYLAAAELLDEQVKQIAERLKAAGADANAKTLLGGLRGSLGVRMHYYYATHFREQGDHAQAAKHLDLAIEQDKPQLNPTSTPIWDIDVLIGLHRLPDPAEDRHRTTEQMIEQTGATYQQLIERDPEEATNYNQLAWLWANTDRNLKEALSLSLKSLELKPNEAGYLDTLARCYFALGDLENAVASQKNAVALDPHSGQMNRQLKQFEEALAKSRATSDKS